ncbi:MULTISPECIES: SDR family oxidoreductase [unclassified Mucilaginibacter]|uniref:SDR family oxidoreductase n=1 Tax=unclassified Mucilaginibacter TaxID=2617802 RepID=UPI00138D5704|nr:MULTISPECIES: SDR family oxidoreductase [unclassified Mucilaginibacter]MBB5396058.1 UDP-N-acetylglucosamine 4-epimerase [Mucilaginibacter sp. AK015]QHS54279.1 SDR family oxidoreductase [Mucilaginibacter sp. 14171R-50]
MYTQPYHQDNLSESSFLITGGAGFIGSNLVEYLLKYGAKKVRVLDNFSTGLRENLEPFLSNPAFELMEGDIREFADCQKALAGIQYVSHQAALGSVPRSINDPITTNNVNITGFLNMLTAARDAGVKRMVYAASSSTYGDHPGLPKVEDQIGNPLSPYAVTKYVNELYAAVYSKVYDFHAVGLRYFNVFGPRQNPKGAYAAVIPLFIDAALKGEGPVINGDGETSRDFTFVENAVQANIKALTQPGIEKHEVINIAFGQKITLNELWAEISKIADLDIEPTYKPERKGDVKHSLANISKAGHLIGYKPLFSVFEGLNIAYNWYKSNKQ